MVNRTTGAKIHASCFDPIGDSGDRSLPQVSSAQRGKGNWERLGCEEVGRRSDRDVIRVGRREGRFKAIRLAASGNDVQVST